MKDQNADSVIVPEFLGFSATTFLGFFAAFFIFIAIIIKEYNPNI
jgi:hypothetical protein